MSDIWNPPFLSHFNLYLSQYVNISPVGSNLGYVVWNKTHIFWQDKKIVNKKSLPFGPLSPHRESCICIAHGPELPRGRNTCSTVKRTFSQHQQDDSWKITFLLHLVGGTWPTSMTLRPGLCKLSVIPHLMCSPLSQKIYINCVLTSNQGTVLRVFWDVLSGL